MTRLQKIAYALTFLFFTAGLGLAAFAQLALMSHDGGTLVGGYQGYMVIVELHVRLMVLSFPCGIVAICLSSAARRCFKKRKLLNICAVVLLGCAILGAVLARRHPSPGEGNGDGWKLYPSLGETDGGTNDMANIVYTGLTSPIAWMIGFAILLACALWRLRRPDKGAGILLVGIAGFLGVICALTFGPLWAYPSAKEFSTVQDTYTMVGFAHHAGLISTLLAFTVIITIDQQRRGKTGYAIAAILGGGILVLGWVFVSYAMALGLHGMPKSYVDFPDEFSVNIKGLSITGLALAAFLIACMAIVMVRAFRPGPSEADEFE